jgi:diguanylate cyclase (GGDEF)-like protein/hemerythrin-like metal-binding protein
MPATNLTGAVRRVLFEVATNVTASWPILLAVCLGLAATTWFVLRALWHLYQVTEQLEQLSEVARSTMQGDRHTRTNLSSGPLAHFGRELNDMVTVLCTENRNLKATQRELEQLVSTDRLTGVGNRRSFEQQAEAEVARAKRYGVPTSLILFDVDRFKLINDHFGHQVGDSVLVQLARRVSYRLRDTDSLSRWGGEEFAVLTPCTPVTGAVYLAEKIREIVVSEDFDLVGAVSISLGVAQLRPGECAANWIARADELLYQAKHLGRNQVRASNREPEDTLPFVLVWGDQFVVHHERIDAEHAELFRLTNDILLEHAGEHPLRNARSVVRSNIAKIEHLITHIAEHFQSEESVLAQLNCDVAALDDHAQQHRGLLAKAQELRQRMLDGTLELSELGDFVIRKVVVGHLLNADIPLFASLTTSATLPIEPRSPASLRVRLQRVIRR